MEYFLSEKPEINYDLWSSPIFFCRICTFSPNETLTWEQVSVIACDGEKNNRWLRAAASLKFRLSVTVADLAVEAVEANVAAMYRAVQERRVDVNLAARLARLSLDNL